MRSWILAVALTFGMGLAVGCKREEPAPVTPPEVPPVETPAPPETPPVTP